MYLKRVEKNDERDEFNEKQDDILGNKLKKVIFQSFKLSYMRRCLSFNVLSFFLLKNNITESQNKRQINIMKPES